VGHISEPKRNLLSIIWFDGLDWEIGIEHAIMEILHDAKIILEVPKCVAYT
jgi:hypothetical protein